MPRPYVVQHYFRSNYKYISLLASHEALKCEANQFHLPTTKWGLKCKGPASWPRRRGLKARDT